MYLLATNGQDLLWWFHLLLVHKLSELWILYHLSLLTMDGPKSLRDFETSTVRSPLRFKRLKAHAPYPDLMILNDLALSWTDLWPMFHETFRALLLLKISPRYLFWAWPFWGFWSPTHSLRSWDFDKLRSKGFFRRNSSCTPCASLFWFFDT